MTDKGWRCPICGEWNRDIDITCVNTPEHDAPRPGEDGVIPREQAMRNAGRVFAAALTRIARMTPEEAADAAYVPGGPSREELAAKVRELRAQARRANAA